MYVDGKMEEESSTRFDKSLRELKDLSSQLHHVADYCETSFCSSEDNGRMLVETAKDYVSQAVVTVIDHLGSVSAILENALSTADSVPRTQQRLHILDQRLMTCQQHSQKLDLAMVRWNADFSRHHPRYSSSTAPLRDSAAMRSVSSDVLSCNGSDSEDKIQLPCKNESVSPDPVNKAKHYKDLLPVHEKLSTLPKPRNSKFQFQEAQKLKHRAVKLKMVQNKDIAALIRRGKRILA